MRRIPHGAVSAETTSDADLHDVGYLFPTLQGDPANLLPDSPQTVGRLKALAVTMDDPANSFLPAEALDSPIPSAYTYLGQFIDHDITVLEAAPGAPPDDVDQLVADDLTPIPLGDAPRLFRNGRTGTLDLDSVYGSAGVGDVPRDPADADRMLVGPVTKLGNQPPGSGSARPLFKEDANDLPRRPRSADRDLDRAARIGDPRNDENLIISQLHVGFLKAHNRLVDEGCTFEEARRTLRQHYQWIVVADFLRRVADPAIVDHIVENGNHWFTPDPDALYMPLEFSVAGYRFGHSMVRDGYDFNLNFGLSGTNGLASLGLLFTFTALSGQLGFPGQTPQGDGFDTLPENWIIEWENLAGENVSRAGHARRIDTRLSSINGQGLFSLPGVDGNAQVGLAAVLAARNLLRGYRMRMPTGQALARHLGLPVLSPERLRAVVGGKQAQALQNGDFLEATPLWFYVLAESAAQPHRGDRLGPLGSTLVAEVLIGLVRASADSILAEADWRPTLPSLTPGTFELADLLRYARVLDGGVATTLYVVQAGDTIESIAAAQLGDDLRWPEVFGLNRLLLLRPDKVAAGQQLLLPTGPAPVPQLRFHVVGAGDSLSKLALAELGNAERWPEIFALNADVLTSPNVVKVGTTLQIPPK